MTCHIFLCQFVIESSEYKLESDGNCYLFHTTEKTFEKAMEICRQEIKGGRLMAVKIKQTASFLQSIMREHDIFWLGATDRHKEGAFQWLDAFGNYQDLTLENWANNEPTNSQGREDCLAAFSLG